MITIHKFTQEEAIKALREKHKLAQEDMIEIEGGNSWTIFPYIPPTYTPPTYIPSPNTTPSFPIYPPVWC